jgi:hypothetical protein
LACGVDHPRLGGHGSPVEQKAAERRVAGC